MKNFIVDKMDRIFTNYTEADGDLVHKTIDMLCEKGIAKGVYQDYQVLADVITYLSLFESAVRSEHK